MRKKAFLLRGPIYPNYFHVLNASRLNCVCFKSNSSKNSLVLPQNN
jgi:hypothetical protein